MMLITLLSGQIYTKNQTETGRVESVEKKQFGSEGFIK